MAGRAVPVWRTRTTRPPWPDPLEERMDGAALIVTAPEAEVVIVTGVAAAATAVEAAVVLATVRTVAVLAEEVVCGEERHEWISWR